MSFRVLAMGMVLAVHAAIIGLLILVPQATQKKADEIVSIQLRPSAPAEDPKPMLMPPLRKEEISVSVRMMPMPIPVPAPGQEESSPNEEPPVQVQAQDPPQPAAERNRPANDGAEARKSSDYAALLAARLEQVKRYPAIARLRRQQGVVLVMFTLDRSGSVRSWHIARSSGYAPLDAEVAAMMAAAAPFPSFPNSISKAEESFLVPIEFSLQ